jgi:hypothetical protein
MKKMKSVFLLSLIIFTFGCGKTVIDQEYMEEASAIFTASTPNNYFKTSKKVVVEIYYEPGAEPFVGNTTNGTPFWNIVDDNLKAVFQYRSTPPTVVVPKTLAEMSVLPAQNKSTWTTNEVFDLYTKYRGTDPTPTEARFYVYFLKGNATESVNTIGYSLDGTPIIAIFKNVVTANGGVLAQKYVEQSTIVHELGHALGLVNNGIPMKIAHQDTANGHHTTNSNCVMYWQNEGMADMLRFIQKIAATGSNVLWGPQVLADVQAFSQQ